MKVQIHPKWYQAEVSCACGNHFTVGSTIPEIKVEICSNCHPFYTGQMKYIDTAGRVDAFKTRQKAAAKNVLSKTARRELKRDARIKEEESRPQSLGDLRKAVKAKK